MRAVPSILAGPSSDWNIHSAIANQESLSGLETEMRKLEGLVKEIVDELGYLKKREERFASTNSMSSPHSPNSGDSHLSSLNTTTRPKFCLVYDLLPRRAGGMADIPLAFLLPAQVLD